MQNIRSTGTLPEKKLAKALKAEGLHFLQHSKRLPGKPDIVFGKKKVAVFVDSDFWHGHPKRLIMPQTNIDYWKPKIERNKKRDRQVNRALRKNGWKVIRIWENDVKKNIDICLTRVLNGLKSEIDCNVNR